ncbi:hypothetical protein BC834DRAFT_537708 [Gloeopeniophorella convolvens]|nr:hypothetical protein BC834DRAFT_537708 [Gloeopeniophorella convolvens]
MEQPARPRLAVTDDNDHPSEAPARGTGSVSVPWTTTDAEYGDTSAQIWKLYGFESERYDKALVEGWLNNTSAMLIFTGLFSSIVSSFLVETYKILQPDSGSQTVTLLSQLVSQSNRTGSPALSGPASLSPKIPSSAVRINILMFLSLFLSVSSALASILIQQWAREYLQYSQPSAAPHRRGRVRAYLFLGLRQFQMGSLVYGVPVFLHVSVFLFFWALSDFLHTVNSTVGTVARFCVVALVAIYIALSACPLIFTNSPYRTALTTPIRACAVLFQSALFYAGRVPFRTYGPYPGWRGTRTRRPINAGRAVVLSKKANSDTITPKLDSSVLHWLLQELDERGMDAFLEGLPGYVTSPLADARRLVKGLSADKILLRIREHFTTCVTSSELSPPACISRTRVCISSLHLLSGSMDTSSEQGGLDSVYTESILDHLQSLCNIKDQEVSLRAACVRSLVLQGFWTPFTPSTYGNIPTEPFPDYLVPVYKFLLPRIELPSFQWESLGGTRMGSLQVPQLDNQVNQAFWTRVLHDGPLINLSILANIVISQVQEGGVDFTMCWDTFDVLVESCGSSTIRASDLADCGSTAYAPRRGISSRVASADMTPFSFGYSGSWMRWSDGYASQQYSSTSRNP